MDITGVNDFARAQGFDGAQYLHAWRGYDVYGALFTGDGVSYVGLPLVILVKGETIRMSNEDEAYEHLDETDLQDE